MSLVSRMLHRCLSVPVIMIMASGLYGQEQSAEDRCRHAAAAFLSILKGQEVCPPAWREAVVSSVQRVTANQQDWYVCQMTRGDTKAGYIVLVERDGEMKGVMFSGSAVPKGVADTMSLAADSVLGLTPVRFSDVPAVTMIATMDQARDARLNQVSVGPAASGLASVLLYWQRKYPVPLFVGRTDSQSYAAILEPHLRSAGVIPQAVPASSMHGSDAARSRWLERQAKDRERREQAVRGAGLLEERTVETAGEVGGRRKSLRVTSHRDVGTALRVLSSVVQSQLASHVSVFERLKALQEEELCAEGLPMPKSAGMTAAFLLQEGYLRESEPIERAIESFCRTRGFAVACTRRPLSQLSATDVPCLLVARESHVAVLVGLDDSKEPRWGLVCIPETVVAKRWSLADVMPRPSSSPANSPEFEAAMKTEEDLVTVEDPKTTLPLSLDQGAHIVELSAWKTHWQAVTLSNWSTADNWDVGSAE